MVGIENAERGKSEVQAARRARLSAIDKLENDVVRLAVGKVQFETAAEAAYEQWARANDRAKETADELKSAILKLSTMRAEESERRA